MKLFGTPNREDQALEANTPRSGSGGSQTSKTSNDSPSFGQMKLVIKNTFIGGYDEAVDDDPPRTLARSASDSKLDCQSSASSVVFWYPQRGAGSMSQSSSVASRSDAGDERDEAFEPYHSEAFSSHMAMPYNQQDVPLHIPGRPNQMPQVPVPAQMQMPQGYGGLQRDALPRRPPGTFDQNEPGAGFPMVAQVAQPSMPPQPVRDFRPREEPLEPMPRLTPPPNFDSTGSMAPLSMGEGMAPRSTQELELLKMRASKMQAEVGGLQPSQLAQLQLQLQNEMMQTTRLDAPPMGMMPGGVLKPASEFSTAQASADRSMQFASSDVAQQQLRHQLIESQMQQVQLQQQMQQLQMRQQQLQQQLSTQGEEDAMLAQVPFNDEGERASFGSRLHPDSCNPCIFWFKDKALCNKGVMCDFCHFRHPGQKNKRIRPSKNTRLQMRAAQAAKAQN